MMLLKSLTLMHGEKKPTTGWLEWQPKNTPTSDLEHGWSEHSYKRRNNARIVVKKWFLIVDKAGFAISQKYESNDLIKAARAIFNEPSTEIYEPTGIALAEAIAKAENISIDEVYTSMGYLSPSALDAWNMEN